jgi:hypothetical protein
MSNSRRNAEERLDDLVKSPSNKYLYLLTITPSPVRACNMRFTTSSNHQEVSQKVPQRSTCAIEALIVKDNVFVSSIEELEDCPTDFQKVQLPCSSRQTQGRSTMRGVMCPFCYSNGLEVWCIPGRECSSCGSQC